MSDRYFLDTNILIYAFDPHDPVKASTAGALLREGLQQRTAVISYQVMQEFFNVMHERFETPLTAHDAEVYLETVMRPLLGVFAPVTLCREALHVRERHRLSWYDSLIVAAAMEARCAVLYTEDLQHGQRFGDVVVENPFRG